MKTILFCVFALSVAGTAFAVKCISCPKGPTCTEVQQDCLSGEGRCVSVNGTINGVVQYYKGCAMNCDCKNFINTTDCVSDCCNGKDYCNAGPSNTTTTSPTTQQSVNATDGSTPTPSSNTTDATKPVVKDATPTAHAGIASVDLLALVSLSVLGFLGKLI